VHGTDVEGLQQHEELVEWPHPNRRVGAYLVAETAGRAVADLQAGKGWKAKERERAADQQPHVSLQAVAHIDEDARARIRRLAQSALRREHPFIEFVQLHARPGFETPMPA
jgi:hypothetical protein